MRWQPYHLVRRSKHVSTKEEVCMAKRYWKAFATGAATGAGVAIAGVLLTKVRARRANVVRFERSLQIGSPVEETFRAWSELTTLPGESSMLERISREGNRSHWAVNLEGRRLEWDAEVEQFIPNESIGWKSLNGPKHTGRVTFGSVGNNTIMTLTMNYSPSPPLARPAVEALRPRIAGYIGQALRDFKASLERRGQEAKVETRSQDVAKSSGTYGAPVDPAARNPRFGTQSNPVEFTRPPEAKS
jgi:uncharacterized membrane protein